MKRIIFRVLKPSLQKHWSLDLVFALIRFLCGAMLTIDFGSSKFGMPWSPHDAEFGFLQVAEWFPQDVAEYGGIFALAPVLFAWLAAASEAIGGVFLALGLGTRISAFLIMCTMLVAILFQKWGQGTWNLLPAMGFLWVATYNLILGSGRFGIDHLITNDNNNKS